MKPIIFSNLMVKQILSGNKSMTRMIVKIQDLIDRPDRFRYVGNSTEMEIPRIAKKYDEDIYYCWQLTNSNACDWVTNCPYGNIGTTLWVRESFINLIKNPVIGNGSEKYVGLKHWYKADNCNEMEIASNKWKPSIHMPRSIARIFLKITDIKIERLNDISEQDAIKEGIAEEGIGYWRDYLFPVNHTSNPIASFQTLFSKINGKEILDINPWVWVIEFERITN